MSRSKSNRGNAPSPAVDVAKAKRQLAVALRYIPDGEAGPQVTASGRGKLAEQILRTAFDHGIKVRKDADLAELLSALDVGDEIPVEAFTAVAEILTYVYRATGEYPDEILADAKKTAAGKKQD